MMEPKSGSDTKRTPYAGLTWRKDMEQFITGMLKELAVRDLQWHLEHNLNRGFVMCTSLDQIGNPDEIECILCLEATHHPILQEWRTSEATINQCIQELIELLRPLAKRFRTVDESTGTRILLSVQQLVSLASKPPLEFPTIHVAGRTVPVYYLSELLGKEKVGQLFTNLEDKREGFAVVRKSDFQNNCAVRLHKHLLQLQMYLATS